MKFLRKLRDWEDVDAFGAGQVIFTEREPAERLYVILSGEVRLTLRGAAVATEGEGGVIGEMTMIESASNNTTATALGDVRLARFDRKQLHKAVKNNTPNASTYHTNSHHGLSILRSLTASDRQTRLS